MNTCLSHTLCGSKGGGRTELSSWNYRRSGGHLRRRDSNMRLRGSDGNRRRALGRLRERPKKKRRRRGCTSRRSLLHGSDGKVKPSGLVPSPLTFRKSNPRAVAGKEATRGPLTTLRADRARTDLHLQPRSLLRGMIHSTVYQEHQDHNLCALNHSLFPSLRLRLRTLPTSENDVFRCFPPLLPRCRCSCSLTVTLGECQ